MYKRSLEEYFDKYFENILTPTCQPFGCRGGGVGAEGTYSCQSVLLALSEEYRNAMDRSDYVVSILMNLSKAFDSICPLL